MKYLGLNTQVLEGCGASNPALTLCVYTEHEIYFLEVTRSKNNNKECWFALFCRIKFSRFSYNLYWLAVPIEFFFCVAVRKL